MTSISSSSTRRVAMLGLLLCLGLILSYVESLIPLPIGIPGVKLGLANLVVVVALWQFRVRDALVLSLARILLAGFLFGSMASILYSLAGGLLSLLVMTLLSRAGKLHVISVSTAGGIAHNAGQLLCAMAVVSNLNLLYYGTVLFVSGLVTGLVIGVIAGEVLKRIGGAGMT